MSTDVREMFVKNLRYQMEKHDKQQIDLVRELNLKPTTVNYWYNGLSYPRPEKMSRLARYFGVTITELTGVPSLIEAEE